MSDLEEKTVLLEQVQELVKIVDLKENQIQELRKKLEVMEQRFQEQQIYHNEILKREYEIKKKEEEAKKLYHIIMSGVEDSQTREEKAQEQSRQNEAEREELNKYRKRLKEAEKYLTDAKEHYQKKDLKLKINSGIVLGFVVTMALRSGIGTDAVELFASMKKLAGSLIRIGRDISAGIPLPVIPLFIRTIPIVLLVAVALIIIIAVYRYVSRYLDMTSMELTYGALYASILVSERFRINGAMFFLFVEAAYLIFRTEKDARDINSPYNRIY